MLRPEDCIPGTLVECVRKGSPTNSLVLRRVYVIEDVLTGHNVDGEPDIGVTVVGAVPSVGFRGFDRRCFRLLPDERLAIFRHMLAPAPKQKERV